MKSEDMKMEKFKLLVRDIENYFGICPMVQTSKNIAIEGEKKEKIVHPILYFIEKRENDLWLDNIIQNTFLGLVDCMNISRHHGSIDLDVIAPNNIMDLITQIRRCNCDKGRNCNISSKLMFWLIFSVSVDNENYSNNLNVIADVAFLLGFDEETLADWITAVKGVLAGKKLYEIEYKTEVGKRYFVRDERY